MLSNLKTKAAEKAAAAKQSDTFRRVSDTATNVRSSDAGRVASEAGQIGQKAKDVAKAVAKVAFTPPPELAQFFKNPNADILKANPGIFLMGLEFMWRLKSPKSAVLSQIN